MPTADTGAVTLFQRFSSASNLNIHLHCLVLDGVYRRTGGKPVFQEARVAKGEELQGLLEKIIVRLVKRLTRLGYLVEVGHEIPRSSEGVVALSDLSHCHRGIQDERP